MEENIKGMEDITDLDLMKEFIKLTDKPLQRNELTVSMFMEMSGESRNRSRYILSKYEQSGILKSRKVTMNSTSVNAYSPADGTWKDVVEAMKS